MKQEIQFDKSTKGLEPIKHLGGKSKSRYEVLFCIQNSRISFEKLISQLIENSEVYNSTIISIYIENNDSFYINRIAKILHSRDYKIALQVPNLNEKLRDKFYEISDAIMYFEKNHITIQNNLDNIIISILTNTLFIEWLLLEIEANQVDYEDLIYILRFERIIELFPNTTFQIWSSIVKNKKLLNKLIDERFVFLNTKYKVFHNKFVELLLGADLIYWLDELDLQIYYENIAKLDIARNYAEKYLREKLTENSTRNYRQFMANHYPNENIEAFINRLQSNTDIHLNEPPF